MLDLSDKEIEDRYSAQYKNLTEGTLLVQLDHNADREGFFNAHLNRQAEEISEKLLRQIEITAKVLEISRRLENKKLQEHNS
ncbi:MAG: hypothetical protein K9M44_02465 [Candidatus Pacebacteria bacterium]|nr:hypothetical protein [Candidatus Paceibacterota bacterium]